MRGRYLVLGVVMVILVLSPTFAAAQFEHPDMKGGKAAVRSVLILPPRVTVSKAGVKGNEPLIEESQRVESALPGLVARALEERGCKILANPFTAEVMGQDSELKYALTDIQDRFDALQEQLDKKPKDVRKGRFTLGDEVTKVNAGSAADAVVFVRGSGFLSTGGKKAFALLIGGPGLVEGIGISIAVLEGKTGNVLYYGRSTATGNFVKNTQAMAKPIDKSFKNFIGPTGKKKK